jgi:hypothetical protein
MLLTESSDHDTYHCIASLSENPYFEMIPRFNYLPLQQDDSFRVLRLYGSSAPDAQIHCDIIHTNLQDPLPYEAVSYTWEDQIADQVISVAHSSLTVTYNCQAALRHLRPSQKDASRVLWIDIVCIDQATNSSPEKNHQVKLMGKILRLRSKCWLGSSHGEQQRNRTTGTYERLHGCLNSLKQVQSWRVREKCPRFEDSLGLLLLKVIAKEGFGNIHLTNTLQIYSRSAGRFLGGNAYGLFKRLRFLLTQASYTVNTRFSCSN